jgi:uncharacterized protein (DUF2141 family)
MIWNLIVAAGLYVAALSAAGAADLTVTVSGIRNASGSVSAGIYDSANSFPKVEEAVVVFRIKARPGTVGFAVHGLAPGHYAVVAYHDENGNGRLDFDPTGAPAEGYGVSNGARNPQAPPEFAKAAFELGDQNEAVTIEIAY